MSTAKFDTLSTLDGSQSVPVSTVAQGSAKAWVNFNGSASPITIRGSFNVSSITDNGVGDYTVNFTNAMPDANYAAFVIAGENGTAGNYYSFTASNVTTASVRANSWRSDSFARLDRDSVSVVVFD